MCGISFFASVINHELNLNESLNLIKHRGPDSSSIVIHKNKKHTIGLGHNRLSIMDLSSNGNQPMYSLCNNFVMIYNGELYNKSFLLGRLKNYSPKSTSDSEVLLQYFIEFGLKGLNDLNGMFAVVIYDIKNNLIYTFRDRLGIKPIYYYHAGDQLFISSEIKALVPFLNNIEIDKESIYEFFRLGYLLEPNTGFKNIFKVGAGNCLIFSQNETDDLINVTTKRYVKEINNVLYPNIDDICERQVESDVKTGIFFSAGKDSTAIATALPNTELLFISNDVKKTGIDSNYVDLFSERTGRFVDKVKLSDINYDIFEIAKFIAEGIEEPISDFTFYSQYLIAKHAHNKGFKVMLSGIGADEIFFGYPRFKLIKARKIFNKVRIILKNQCFKNLFVKWLPNRGERLYYFLFSTNFFEAYSSITGYFHDNDLSKMLSPDLFYSGRKRFVKIISNFDKRFTGKSDYYKAYQLEKSGFLPHNLLVTDKACMLQSIESRVPFLDNAFVMFCEGILEKDKVGKIFDKKIIKKFLRQRHLGFILNRKKGSFNIELHSLIKTKNYQSYLDFFNCDEFKNYVSRNYINDLLSDHFTGRKDNSYKIWQLVFFKTWLEKYELSHG